MIEVSISLVFDKVWPADSRWPIAILFLLVNPSIVAGFLPQFGDLIPELLVLCSKIAYQKNGWFFEGLEYSGWPLLLRWKHTPCWSLVAIIGYISWGPRGVFLLFFDYNNCCFYLGVPWDSVFNHDTSTKSTNGFPERLSPRWNASLRSHGHSWKKSWKKWRSEALALQKLIGWG